MRLDYKDVTRETMLAYWKLWDECTGLLNGYEIHSCIGNHDPWWAAPSREDEMYGKNYVVKRLKTPGRYYSFTKKNWHFVILDGNNDHTALDDEQYQWLTKRPGQTCAGDIRAADVALPDPGHNTYACGRRQGIRITRN